MNDHVTFREDVVAPDAARGAFARRYGTDLATVPETWNDVLAALFAHRSVRAYLPDALPDGTLQTLIGAAQSAASSSNLQTWSVVAVQDADRRKRLAAWAGNQTHIEVAPLLLVFLADLSRAERVARARGTDPVALDYLELTIVATVDAALAAQNAVVAAESLGLGTVYIGAIRNQVSKVAEELKLPHSVYPVFGLVVGWPDPQRPTDVKPRLDPSVVLHHETYGTKGEAAQLDNYNRRMNAFQDAQNLARVDWTQVLTDRVSTVAGLHGRERLRAALEGFGLKLK
jgi:nitroreductase